ncbi:helix-turn-helix domain-containing protein [Rhizobium sp. SGZ-381]|uniref:helix-turn-helix domain-containing protein n=1 Tax=Rhizobium sp. SGZ-381 TaxID=3342800 RepID=UPI003672E094
MTAADRKAAFRKLSSGHDLDDLARLLGYTPSTLRTWLNPAHPRAPSDQALSRLRNAVIAELTDKIRGLGLEVIPRRNSVGEPNGNIFDNAA